MSTEKSRPGKPFGVGPQIQKLLLIAAGRDIDRDTPFWELVTNSMEAKAKVIKIWPTGKPGRWVHVDDGIGMTPQELLERLSEFASSGKEIGADDNFGAGFKLCVLVGLARNVRVISRAENSKDFYRADFGSVDSGGFGPQSIRGRS